MSGQLVGESAHLTSSHGIGLSGEGKGAHAGFADASGGQMAVDDGIDLVGPEGPLVHTLGIDADSAFGRREPVEKPGHRFAVVTFQVVQKSVEQGHVTARLQWQGRSAMSQVGVRRGSTTTSFISGRACFAARMR